MIEYVVLSCVFILFVLIVFILRKFHHGSKYLKGIPGPKPIFPLGSTLDFIGGSTVLLPTLMKYFYAYGETVAAYDGAFSRILCTIDHELLEYFYSSTEHIDKSRQYNFLDKWLGQGLLTSTGAKWRAHRKMLTNSFHFSILKNFVGVFESVGDNLIIKLQKETGKDSVEISKIISLYTLDVICESAMGIKINAMDGGNSSYVKNIKTECEIIIARTFSPVSPSFYRLTWNYYKEKSALKVIHTYVEDVINQRIKERNDKNFNNSDLIEMESNKSGVKKRLAFLDLLLEATINGQPLSMEDIKDEVNTFMFEGHDTTSSAITFCLLMLATHPDVQEKVLKEQVNIFTSDIKNAIPSMSQLNEMKYLELVIKETLRLFPSVPFYGRQLNKEIELKGILYPKGLVIMFCPFIAHRNPKYFLEPDKFIPERFIEYNGKFPFWYTPFSAGPRNCIGQKFAMLEMISVVSKVIRNFELEPARPKHEIQLAAETILISKNGVRISLKNRGVQDTA